MTLRLGSCAVLPPAAQAGRAYGEQSQAGGDDGRFGYLSDIDGFVRGAVIRPVVDGHVGVIGIVAIVVEILAGGGDGCPAVMGGVAGAVVAEAKTDEEIDLLAEEKARGRGIDCQRGCRNRGCRANGRVFDERLMRLDRYDRPLDAVGETIAREGKAVAADELAAWQVHDVGGVTCGLGG